MERRRGPVVDGISRFLSSFAVLAGVSGGYLLYNENQQIRQQLASVEQGSDGESEYDTSPDDSGNSDDPTASSPDESRIRRSCN